MTSDALMLFLWLDYELFLLRLFKNVILQTTHHKVIKGYNATATCQFSVNDQQTANRSKISTDEQIAITMGPLYHICSHFNY